MDLVARIQKLPPGSAFARQEMGDCADWGLHEENTARLFDLANWYIQTIWMDRITDPDDPDIKAEQQRAKRAGIKPPESPLIPPVAHRPPSLQDSQIAEFKQLAERYKVPPKLKIGEADPMDLLMQWNRMIGIA
ncbi:hypothetical protein N8J89_08125 [Crossiella sp. CA-258035]|uniref:hypothetical protein n=1 Tax=Crossiella sp. CA-258035 TaxID=2981138 RepID=UPI0024BC7E81|nr:hypothetical protein [Crossiella sp. CA-258035]WHT21022.1 hypothetical protein N8J89_08125 [Crossiella sp. CA-258035]